MDLKEVIGRRRAVNFFDPGKPVSNEVLSDLIEIAAKVPTSFNLQPWSLMVLKDPIEY